MAFPAEKGDAGEFERRGMVAAVGDLIEAGRVKLYCVDSFDSESWSNRGIPLEERARRHQVYESWILDQVVPFIRHECGGTSEVIACGCRKLIACAGGAGGARASRCHSRPLTDLPESTRSTC